MVESVAHLVRFCLHYVFVLRFSGSFVLLQSYRLRSQLFFASIICLADSVKHRPRVHLAVSYVFLAVASRRVLAAPTSVPPREYWNSPPIDVILASYLAVLVKPHPVFAYVHDGLWG